ncbi:MAG: Panacea domain-containing protein [Dehalococcoidia bacterium]
MPSTFPSLFDPQKATQALNFLARKAGGRINRMKALKLLYFADRYHLRKYGRLITKDDYFAMYHGPVPSGTKDISEFSNVVSEKDEKYASRYIATVERYDIRSVESPDLEVFSDSDIEALDFTWNNFGHLDQFALADLTHKYPEWQKHQHSLQDESTKRVDMVIEDFLNDPVDDVNRCYDLDAEEREALREELKETAEIERLLG